MLDKTKLYKVHFLEGNIIQPLGVCWKLHAKNWALRLVWTLAFTSISTRLSLTTWITWHWYRMLQIIKDSILPQTNTCNLHHKQVQGPILVHLMGISFQLPWHQLSWKVYHVYNLNIPPLPHRSPNDLDRTNWIGLKKSIIPCSCVYNFNYYITLCIPWQSNNDKFGYS